MEILNTYSVYSEFIGFLPVLSICILLVFAIIFICTICNKEWKNSMKCFIAIFPLLILTHVLILWQQSTETKYHEVIISDYNQIDFNKYEIVNKKGKITVLKEIK